jgi:exosortase/archaeosortase family protein
MAKRLQRKKTLVIDEERLKTVLKFIIIFNVLSLPMYLIMYLNYSYTPLQIFLTDVSYKFLNSLGYDTQLVRNTFCVVETIKVPNLIQPICISWDSTGWKSMYALFSLALATPIVTYRKKLRFLIIGLPTIFVLNILRIVTTIILSINFGEQYFEVVHTVLWREGLIFAVVGIWFFWLWKERHNSR